MFVLTVMLVVFFIVAVSSWWLDDFAVAEDESTLAPNSQSIVAPHEQLSPHPIPATLSN